MRYENLAEIGRCLDVTAPDQKVMGFKIDSRHVKGGDLFFALKGGKFNGHDFLKEVAAKGGIAAVVDADYKGESGGLFLLKVENVVQALQELAQKIQARRQQKIVAVTGSLGKTTTKEFIATLLSQKYTVAKTPGNSNSQLGLPLAILNGAGKEEIFVAEMGMWKMGEIRRLVEIAPPDIALVTKIGFPHVESFPDGLEGIAAAKAEIFTHPRTQLGIVGFDTLQYGPIRDTGIFAKKSYALAPAQANFVLEEGRLIQEGDQISPILRLPFSESHFCENFVGAASVARMLGLSWSEMMTGIQSLKSCALRYEKIEREGVVFINDCYNASPESMQVALINLPRPAFGGKTIGVFGEMTGLGVYSEEKHRQLAEQALPKVEHVLCFGKGCLPIMTTFDAAGKPAEFFHDLDKLKITLFELAKPGDVVLIKGSNANQLWQILEDV